MATRREFAAAAAATAAAALVAAGAGGLSQAHADGASSDDAAGLDDSDGTATSDEGVVEPSTDTVAVATSDDSASSDSTDDDEEDSGIDEDGNVNILVAFEDIIDATTYTPVATIQLPLGSNVYADCETRAAVVQANESNRPFTVLGCIDYATNGYSVVLSQAITGSSYAPAEAHCTDRLIAWLEIDNATDDWALYAAPFSGSSLDAGVSGMVKLADGDANWLPAQFAVEDDIVVWQVMPDPSGPYSTSYSHAYRWRLGGSAGTEVCESPGRFACGPSISAGVLTLAPRVNPEEGVYYGITAYDIDGGMEQLDQLVLPVSVKPFFATRIGDAFAFSIEANYGYGGLLGSMGYYIGPSTGPFEYVVREPYAQISYVNGCHIIKSRLSYFVIDLNRRTYATISSVNGCVDYGDYPATSGTVANFVTYAAVKDSSTGVPYGVTVRIFTLV